MRLEPVWTGGCFGMKIVSGLFLQKTCARLLMLVAFAAPAFAQQRIVVIGDVHGAFPEFVSILQHMGLTDADRRWTGKSTILVQTGDVMDRGPEARKALDFLMELESQAAKQNGKVIPLLGNHEVMNMIGDLRYVTAADYASFANAQSDAVREKAYQGYREFLRAHPMKRVPDDEAAHQAWAAQHPLGYFEQRDAYGPQGQYGRWLRQHDAVAQVGDILFMHGGLDPELRFRDIEQLNERIRSELRNFDALWESLSQKRVIWRYMTWQEGVQQAQKVLNESESGQKQLSGAAEDIRKFLGFRDWLLISQDSPLWYRGLALGPEEKLEKSLDKMLRRLNVHYIVAAHTVRPKFNVMTRFNNRVFLIDTGMLHSYYGGRASALEIQSGRFTAYYADSAEPERLVGPGAVTAATPDHPKSGGDH